MLKVVSSEPKPSVFLVSTCSTRIGKFNSAWFFPAFKIFQKVFIWGSLLYLDFPVRNFTVSLARTKVGLTLPPAWVGISSTIAWQIPDDARAEFVEIENIIKNK